MPAKPRISKRFSPQWKKGKRYIRNARLQIQIKNLIKNPIQNSINSSLVLRKAKMDYYAKKFKVYEGNPAKTEQPIKLGMIPNSKPIIPGDQLWESERCG